MKAVFATGYGPPERLELKEIAIPTPGDHDILVKVMATTVNAGDARMRAFRVPPLLWLPARLMLGLFRPRQPVFGLELSGEVIAVGAKVTRFKTGDAVLASTEKAHFGAHAEYKCLPENGPVALKPGSVSFEDAATLPIGAVTALHFLEKAGIQSGQQVLIYGASGAVGTFAVQLARFFGARVTGVCSTTNLALVQSLGAQMVIDYTRTDVVSGDARYDLVFDTVGGLRPARARRILKAGGRFVTALGFDSASADASRLDFLTALVARGELRPVIDRRYRIDQLVEAHRYVDTQRKKGHVVVLPWL